MNTENILKETLFETEILNREIKALNVFKFLKAEEIIYLKYGVRKGSLIYLKEYPKKYDLDEHRNPYKKYIIRVPRVVTGVDISWYAHNDIKPLVYVVVNYDKQYDAVKDWKLIKSYKPLTDLNEQVANLFEELHLIEDLIKSKFLTVKTNQELIKQLKLGSVPINIGENSYDFCI